VINLIPYHPSFLDSFVGWRSEPSWIRHNPIRQLPRSQIEKMLLSEATNLGDLKNFDGYRWFVEYGGVVVGNVSLKNVSPTMQYAEIGYGITEAYQGLGVATNAVRLLIDMAFSESSLRKLIAYVHDKNIPSRRVLEKLRFTQEGLLREHYIINGRPEDELLFGLLKHEWELREAP
jgi:ribosomal-protein-alanine N-acetyltransferase